MAVVVTGAAGTGAQAGGASRELGNGYACAPAWLALTAAHARIAEHLTVILARTCGLTISDFEILHRLDQALPPGLRVGELNSAVRLTQPSLSRAVARLEGRGLLSRAGSTGDRRGVLVSITAAGRDLMRAAVPVHARTIREFLLDPLTPAEHELISRALSRIAESGRPGEAAGTRSPAGT